MSKTKKATAELILKSVGLLKTNENYLRASSSDKTKQIKVLIATNLAYYAATIPSDSDMALNHYFTVNIAGDWNQILSDINEQCVINYEEIAELAKRLYLARWNQAHGHRPIGQLLKSICADSYLSDNDRQLISAAADAY